MQLFLNIINPSQYPYIFGTSDLTLFWSCVIFGYIGMLIRVLIDVHKRSPATSPAKFSWKYFWTDNNTRFIVNIILVALAVRFIPDPNFLGKTLTPFGAFMVGFGSDYLVQQLKSKEKAFLGDASADDTTTTIENTLQQTTVTTQAVTQAVGASTEITTVVASTPTPIANQTN